MARPQPTIICSHQDGDILTEVCSADAVYAVLYRGEPIALRKHHPDIKYMGYKYAKTMFPSPGHAFGLAKRLNEAHNTADFTVAIMGIVRTISQ
jgi:hypothetical protein